MIRRVLSILILALAPLAVTALVGAVIAAIDRVRESRRHAHILAELGAPSSAANAFGAARNQVITVEGQLVSLGDDSGTGRLVSFHPYGTSFLDEMNAYAVSCSTAQQGFAIELDGGAGRAILDGPAQVLRGAIETEHSASLDHAATLGAEPLARSKVKKRVGQFRVVEPGDRVRVRGAVVPAPDDDALYRARSNVLRMTPGDSSGLGEPVIAVASTSSRRRRTSRRAVLPAVAASVVVSGALVGGAVRLGLPAHAPPAPAASNAASAGPREPACRAAVLTKLSRFEIGDQGCDDAWSRAMAHYAAGEFALASAAFAEARASDEGPPPPPSLSEVEAHLFAHSFERAAATVRRMDAQFYPGPSTPEKRLLECILEILEERARSGIAKAGDAGDAGDSGPRFVKVCSTRPFAKAARMLDSDGQYLGQDDWPRMTFLHDARYDAVGETFTSVVATRSRLAARPVALERDLLDRMAVSGKVEQYFSTYADELEPLLGTFAAEVTLFYAYAGFPERAARYWPFLDRVAGMVEQGKTFHQAASKSELERKAVEDERNLLVITLGVAGAAALYANEPDRLKRYTAVGEPYTSQAARQMARLVLPNATWEDPVVDRIWPESKAVFDAAVHQNASEVVRVLTVMHSTGRTTLPRALPQLAAHRAALDAWFRSDAYPAACLTCGASGFLGDLSDRREVARLLGDTAERDRLRASAERFTTALTDPQLGFELDELETFFSKRK